MHYDGKDIYDEHGECMEECRRLCDRVEELEDMLREAVRLLSHCSESQAGNGEYNKHIAALQKRLGEE